MNKNELHSQTLFTESFESCQFHIHYSTHQTLESARVSITKWKFSEERQNSLPSSSRRLSLSEWNTSWGVYSINAMVLFMGIKVSVFETPKVPNSSRHNTWVRKMLKKKLKAGGYCILPRIANWHFNCWESYNRNYQSFITWIQIVMRLNLSLLCTNTWAH